MRSFLATALLACLTTATALADSAPDVSKMNSDDCARARKLNKTCVLDIIEDEKITGKVPTGGGSTVVIPIDPKHSSLIRIRRDFIVEILKSAEDL